MTCEHRMQRGTSWSEYALRRPGILQQKLIRTETCERCGKQRVSSTEGIRAVRERAERLADRPEALRYSETDSKIIAILLRSAERVADEHVAYAGNWNRQLERRIGRVALDDILNRLLDDGLITLESSRTRKKAGRIIAASWPNEQYRALCNAFNVEPDERTRLRAALERALQIGPSGKRAALTALFWSDQLEQLTSGRADIEDQHGNSIITSASARYPDLLAATFELAGIPDLLEQGSGSSEIARALEAIYGEPADELLPMPGPEVVQVHGHIRAVDLDPSLGLSPPIPAPAKRVLLIQKQTVYDALRQLPLPEDVLLIQVGGMPSRTRQTVLERLARSARVMMVWCELDPVGVNLARTIMSGLSGVESKPFLMGINEWASLPKKKLTTLRGRYAELVAREAGPVADVAAAIATERSWVPQEAMIGAARSSLNLPAANIQPVTTTPPEWTEVRLAAYPMWGLEARNSEVEVRPTARIILTGRDDVGLDQLSGPSFRLLLGGKHTPLAGQPRASAVALNLQCPDVTVTTVSRHPLVPQSKHAALRVELTVSDHVDASELVALTLEISHVRDQNMLKAIDMFQEGNATSNAAAAVRSFAASIELAVNARQKWLGHASLSSDPLDAAASGLTGLPQGAFERARIVYNRTKHVDENERQRRIYEDAMRRVSAAAVESRNCARSVVRKILPECSVAL